MKQLLLAGSHIAMLLLGFWSSQKVFAYTIVIDPGHGGADRGATSSTVIESKIALQVALRLQAKLSESQNTKVLLTRETDSSLSLKRRVQLSETTKADLFISLHGNSSPDRRAKGAEFYFAEAKPSPKEPHSKDVIPTIVQDLAQQARLFQSHNLAVNMFQVWKSSEISLPRAIKQAPFYVINKNSTPSLLVEFGFISNAKESSQLLTDTVQEQIAQNIKEAVISWLAQNSARPSFH